LKLFSPSSQCPFSFNTRVRGPCTMGGLRICLVLGVTLEKLGPILLQRTYQRGVGFFRRVGYFPLPFGHICYVSPVLSLRWFLRFFFLDGADLDGIFEKISFPNSCIVEGRRRWVLLSLFRSHESGFICATLTGGKSGHGSLSRGVHDFTFILFSYFDPLVAPFSFLFPLNSRRRRLWGHVPLSDVHVPWVTRLLS